MAMETKPKFVVGKISPKGQMLNHITPEVIGVIRGEVGVSCIVEIVYAADSDLHKKICGYKFGVSNPEEFLRPATANEASFAEYVMSHKGQWIPPNYGEMFLSEEAGDENPHNEDKDEGEVNLKDEAEQLDKEEAAALMIAKMLHDKFKSERSKHDISTPQDYRNKRAKLEDEAATRVNQGMNLIQMILDALLQFPADYLSEEDKLDIVNLSSYLNVRTARHAANDAGIGAAFHN